MIQLKKMDIFAAGLAIFSMFFGAGNIIFPLALGYATLDQIPYAIVGLLLTAVVIPFAGLFAMFLYQGDIKQFFQHLGKGPGLILAFLIIALLGPLGSTPRCIALAYSTFKIYVPGASSIIFSAFSCLVIFFFSYKKGRLLGLLGYVLTPVLVGLLIFIIIKGFIEAPTYANQTDLSHFNAFMHGLKEGYYTMDLLASFFFAPLVLNSLKKRQASTLQGNLQNFILKASGIGALLLAMVYIGFSYLAYSYASQLRDISNDQLLAAIAIKILGPYAGLIVGLIVILACLTTAMALIAAFTEFLHKEILAQKVSDISVLIGGIIITFFVAIFEFNSISQFLNPVLQVCYPALILLTGFNICYKLEFFRN